MCVCVCVSQMKMKGVCVFLCECEIKSRGRFQLVLRDKVIHGRWIYSALESGDVVGRIIANTLASHEHAGAHLNISLTRDRSNL